jgi:hypothetical protein
MKQIAQLTLTGKTIESADPKAKAALEGISHHQPFQRLHILQLVIKVDWARSSPVSFVAVDRETAKFGCGPTSGEFASSLPFTTLLSGIGITYG